MACACAQCLRNARTLGLGQEPPSRSGLRKAFRSAAKRWHPDQFENDPLQRLRAEEQFKSIQVAYRELWEHCDEEEEEELPAFESAPVAAAVKEELPPVFFGGARGCYVAPRFPAQADRILSEILEGTERAVALIDLSGNRWQAGDLSHFLVLTNYRLIVRDAHNIVSLIWYTDLGDILLLDRWKKGKQSLWQKLAESIAGNEQRYALRIHWRDGTIFRTLTDEIDDSVKKVVYNFLRQRKRQTGS